MLQRYYISENKMRNDRFRVFCRKDDYLSRTAKSLTNSKLGGTGSTGTTSEKCSGQWKKEYTYNSAGYDTPLWLDIIMLIIILAFCTVSFHPYINP